jgi:hypothetical protein
LFEFVGIVVKGEKALFKSPIGFKRLVLKSLPDVNGSNTLKRRFDDVVDDVDDADDEDRGE